MNYESETIQNFLDMLASGQPIPGGGAASALCNAMASSLGEMVLNITSRKAFPEDFQIDEKLKELKEFQKENTLSISEDSRNFLELLKAYQFKGNSEEEKNYKQKLLALASLKAADIPLQVLSTSVLILEIMESLLPYISSSLLTDIGVSAELALAALNSSYMNILVNKSGISNPEFLNTIESTVPYLVDSGRQMAYRISNQVFKKLDGNLN